MNENYFTTKIAERLNKIIFKKIKESNYCEKVYIKTVGELKFNEKEKSVLDKFLREFLGYRIEYNFYSVDNYLSGQVTYNDYVLIKIEDKEIFDDYTSKFRDFIRKEKEIDNHLKKYARCKFNNGKKIWISRGFLEDRKGNSIINREDDFIFKDINEKSYYIGYNITKEMKKVSNDGIEIFIKIEKDGIEISNTLMVTLMGLKDANDMFHFINPYTRSYDFVSKKIIHISSLKSELYKVYNFERSLLVKEINSKLQSRKERENYKNIIYGEDNYSNLSKSQISELFDYNQEQIRIKNSIYAKEIMDVLKEFNY